MKIECLGKWSFGHFIRWTSDFMTFIFIREVKKKKEK